MPRIRVHQHVNPLAPYFRFTPKPLDFGQVFANPALPLHLDIGAGRGKFLLQMAEIFPAQNFLGLEIREPLVAEANRQKNEKNLTNLHYEFLNATLALDKLLEKIPADILQVVTIQFPDPWFKKKHAKRRLMQSEMVDTIAEYLTIAGKVFIQTDVEFLAGEMFELFRENKSFREIEIAENPFPVKTEREKAVEEKSLPVYRKIFEKVQSGKSSKRKGENVKM
ncbi:MAG: tRNA (guanosine(46)-N7)-methyltransferase TrmB [Pyrinomonadaceae bacterium]